MSEPEKTTIVVQRNSQPFRITLTRGQRGYYGWTIEVHAEDRYTALYEIDQINDYLQGRYVNGQTRSGIPQNKTEAREDSKTGTVQKPQGPASEDPYQRMQRAIENVKRAAENSPFRGE
jgi:hypothetical protein